MIAKTTESIESASTSTWQDGFLELMPRIERQAQAAFQHMNAEAQEDAVAEVIAHAACAYQRLFQRGELQRAFASTLAKYAILEYFSGRRVGNALKSRDVYSRPARRKAGYEMLSLGAPGEQVGQWMECLIDNRRSPIPDQAAFRMDFPRWLNSQNARDKKIAEWLSLGYSTSEVAGQFKVSTGRISQLRREFAESWSTFVGDAAKTNAKAELEPVCCPG